jgi:hypothetical protein
MDCLFEIILQLLGEFLMGAGIELLVEGIGRFFVGLFRALGAIADFGFDLGGLSSTARDESPEARRRRANVGRVVLWTLAGVASGGVSLLILPGPIVKVPVLHAVNLALTPFAMAAAMVFVGRLLTREHPARRRRTPGNHFACAYGFALCYLLVRFFFAG